jgi:hypothetical protein
MLIGTMNQALAAVNRMNKRQLDGLVYDFEMEGWYCADKRRKRAFCRDVVVSNWQCDRSVIVRLIYNNED